MCNEVEELRAAAAAARARDTSAQDALEAALAAHRAELDERDHRAARAAAAHEQEVLVGSGPAWGRRLLELRGASNLPGLQLRAVEYRFAHLENVRSGLNRVCIEFSSLRHVDPLTSGHHGS